MITRILIVVGLVLSCSLCLAEDFPDDTYEIKSLTAEQAAELVAKFNELAAQKKWRTLSLNGLTSINKDVAKELAKFKNGDYGLSLSGLTSIDKDVARELAKLKGQLHLQHLTSIDKDVAQELAKFKRKTLNLGLTSIDKDVAQELAKFEKGELDLRFLTSIDKDVAQEFAKFKGAWLNLNGLISINKDVAQEFAKFKSKVYLAGLKSIDEVSLAYLKSNKSIVLPDEYRD